VIIIEEEIMEEKCTIEDDRVRDRGRGGEAAREVSRIIEETQEVGQGRIQGEARCTEGNKDGIYFKCSNK
jgi:hypothetical protein